MQFITFEAATTDGLESDRITALAADRVGTLWIGTETGGLSRYREGVFTAYTQEDGLPCDYVVEIFLGSGNKLWINCHGGIIAESRWEEGRLHFTTDHGLPGELIWAVLESGGEPDTRWVGTSNGAVRIRGEERVRFTEDDGLIHSVITSIAESRDGVLWLGTQQGISRLKHGQITNYPIDGLHSIVRIFEDREGTMWAVTEGPGLLHFNGMAFVPVMGPNDPIGPGVVSAIEAREGSLWVGAIGTGLHRLNVRLFTAYTVEDGLPGPQILGVYEDRTGAVWAGTSRSGLARIKNGVIRSYTVRDGLPSNRIWSWVKIRKGVYGLGPTRA